MDGIVDEPRPAHPVRRRRRCRALGPRRSPTARETAVRARCTIVDRVPGPAEPLPPTWAVDLFLRSLTSLAPTTIAAYERDVGQFVVWAGRLGLDGPQGVDRRVVRRFVAHLTTRRYARRTIARRVSALRRYFDWARRQGLIETDPTVRLSCTGGRGSVAAHPAPAGDRQPARRSTRSIGSRRRSGRARAGDPTEGRSPGTSTPSPWGTGTTPSWRSSTAAGCALPRPVPCDRVMSTSPVSASRSGARDRSSASCPCRARRPRPSGRGSIMVGRCWPWPTRRPTPCSSTREAAGSALVTFVASSTAAHRCRPTPTHCVTPLPLIFWTEVPI